ncbi:MAG TPA: porin, partial [Flavisolibacter sp.]|nr:porin [Flavisolibacter sp.]
LLHHGFDDIVRQALPTKIDWLMKTLWAGFMLAAQLFSTFTFAQTTLRSQNKTGTEYKDSSAPEKEHRITFAGMMITRFTQSFTDKIDVNGRYHPVDDVYATTSFAIRRVRVQARTQINAKTDAAVLVNLTDFTGNPAYKVLENAFIRYHFNDYLNLQVGQFRPYFGREDLYPEELLQVMEWSSQYYAFGVNGWQSFQTGATVYGKVNIHHIPLSYYLGMFNGNGRNQPMDNDNGKLFPFRLELTPKPSMKVGLNGGVGKDGKENVWAFNADIDHVEKLGRRWQLEVQGEYKTGLNNSLFDTSTEQNKAMNNYLLHGFYVLPDLRYTVNSRQVKSVELAMRYEQLTCDSKNNRSTKQTWMPVLCLQLENDYALKLLAGLIIDQYFNKLPDSKDRDGTRFVCQLVARF